MTCIWYNKKFFVISIFTVFNHLIISIFSLCVNEGRSLIQQGKPLHYRQRPSSAPSLPVLRRNSSAEQDVSYKSASVSFRSRTLRRAILLTITVKKTVMRTAQIQARGFRFLSNWITGCPMARMIL